MTITAITIENFKGIKEPVRIEFKPITLLFGPNSAGKSTIIHALHYAHEIFERQNFNPNQTILGGDSIDLGGFKNLVHQHDTTLPIKLGFELDLRKEKLPDYKKGYEDLEHWSAKDRDDEEEQERIDFFDSVLDKVEKAKVLVTVTVCWSSLLEKPVVTSYEININDNSLATLIFSDDTRQIALSRLNSANPIFISNEEEKAFGETEKVLRNELKGAGKDGKLRADVSINNLVEAFRAINFSDKFLELIDSKNNIRLLGQASALPTWETPILLDKSFFNKDATYYEVGFFVKMLSALIVGPGELVRDGLRKLCYIGPLRKVPERNYKPANAPEKFRWANGLAAYDTLSFADDDFTDKVNKWLTRKERLDSGYSVKIKRYRELESDNPFMQAKLHELSPEELTNLRKSLLALPVNPRLLIRDEIRNIELMPQDIGVGISQVLPVVVAALHAKTGLVAIEQPELHIHPAFQVALGDLFIEQVCECPNLTFILETHSEHLMLRLLRRIRETYQGTNESLAVTHNDVAVLFVTADKKGSRVVNIPIAEDGDFETDWPEGFFEERERELFD